jgi:hypothetical protein
LTAPQKTRRPRAGSANAAAEAVQGLAVGVPIPPFVRLRDCDRPFWNSIVRARLAGDWAQADLVHVANLARCMADIERMQALLEQEGDTLANSRGTIVMNPRHSLLEILSRRAMALTRLLQLHAVAKGVDTRDQAARKGEALAAAQAMETAGDDDLLAKPLLQ